MLPKFALFRSKILYKGILLVIVPCLIEAGFAWTLRSLNEQSDAMFAEEHKLVEFGNLMNKITACYVINVSECVSYVASGNRAARARAQAGKTELKTYFQRASALAADRPDLAEKVDESRSLIGAQLDMIESLEGKLDLQGTTSALFNFENLQKLKKLIAAQTRNNQQLFRTIIANDQVLDRVRQQATQARSRMQTFILFGIVGNAVLALLAATWFLRGITTRLNVLVDNAKRLPARTALRTPLPGSDELAYLDKSIHAAAGELAAAAEQRQYFMQMITHDLRAPLMSAAVSLDILADERHIADLPPLARRQVDALKRHTSVLNTLTTDLLTIDKLESGLLELDIREIDVEDVAEESAGALRSLASQKEIEVINECEALAVRADGKRTLQVFNNLLSNAITHSPQSSKIVFRTKASPDGFVTISVCDAGPGVASADRERIFNKFHQLEKGSKGGFGLGLAICRMLVEAQGGRIGVTDNESGVGSRFWFTLPKASIGA